jgi:hypothetical protein
MNNHNKNKIEILEDYLRMGVKNPFEMFSLFIASNPDFKYNISYLTDQIEFFKVNRIELKNRFRQFEKIIIQLRKQTPFAVKGYLIFDNIFQYEINNNNEEDHLAVINLDSYRFDKIDSRNYIVKFMLGDRINPEKFETYKIDRETNTDIESQIAIKKLWSSFINGKS